MGDTHCDRGCSVFEAERMRKKVQGRLAGQKGY